MSKLQIDAGPAPLYVRLKEQLRHDIAHDMAPGDLIPSEAALIELYGVSRTTVRLALTALANEGLITRKQGRGSFVSEPKQTLGGPVSLLADSQGESMSTSQLSIERAVPDPEVLSELGLADETEVFRVRWTERIGEGPRCYRVSYLPTEVAQRAGVADSVQSIEQMRESLCGCFSDAVETARYVTVVLADPFRASMLDTAENVPLVRVESVLHSSTGAPLELVRAFYAGHSVRVRL